MALDNMVVFNEYIKPATIETLAQMVEKFNAASAGSIVLSTEGFEGSFLQERFFASLHSAQRRVDRSGVNAVANATDLTQVKDDSVKIAGGFGPIAYEPSSMTWMEEPTVRGIEVASRNMAEAIMQDMLNSSIKALVAAISNVAGATNDISASAGLSYAALNNTHALFGDHSSGLVAQVMDGLRYHHLVGLNLANAQTLFVQGNVLITDFLGKRTIVTDAPDLFEGGTPNKSKVLTLATSAAVVHDGSDLIGNIETTNGKQRLETTFQADYSFGLGLKGYSWDAANGGSSPGDAAIGTGSNWDSHTLDGSSVKHSAGVITIADADQ